MPVTEFISNLKPKTTNIDLFVWTGLCLTAEDCIHSNEHCSKLEQTFHMFAVNKNEKYTGTENDN